MKNIIVPKKTLLINPPFYRLLGSHYNGLKLGLGYIAAILRNNGYEVMIYNADYVDQDSYSTQEQLFRGYEDYKNIFNNSRAEIWQEIKAKIAGFNPDIIGISMFTGAYRSAKIIARTAKEINPDVRVIVGGPHPTLDPQGTMKNEEFDYLIRGEGEFSVLELLGERRPSEILGLGYRRNGEIIINPPREFISNLDSLPFPARDLFLDSGKNLPLEDIMTGRGCPYACAFCASPKIWQRKARFRSVDNVIEELEEMILKYNQKLIYFVDDTFTLIKERTTELCGKIIAKGLKFQWKCDTRADRIDEELLALMKKAGCINAKIGVESGSERILKLINKMETKETIKRAAKMIKDKGLFLTVYFMAGFPGETNEDLRETIEFAKELKADYYSLGIVSPYYGTDIYFMLKNQGKLKETEDWEYFYNQSLAGLQNTDLEPKLVEEFLALNKTLGKERI